MKKKKNVKLDNYFPFKKLLYTIFKFVYNQYVIRQTQI